MRRPADWGINSDRCILPFMTHLLCRFPLIARLALLLLLLCGCSTLNAQTETEDWTHFVRIAGYGLEDDNAEPIVREAQLSHVFGMEADVFVVGRYPNFLDPEKSLSSIRAFAEAAHKTGNKAFIYMAGTECITPNADEAAHTVVRDHPEWVQRKITGELAVFHAGAMEMLTRSRKETAPRMNRHNTRNQRTRPGEKISHEYFPYCSGLAST